MGSQSKGQSERDDLAEWGGPSYILFPSSSLSTGATGTEGIWDSMREGGKEVVLFSEPPHKVAEEMSNSESSLFTIKPLFKMEKGKETQRKRERGRLLPASSLPNSRQSATELCLISR